MRGNPHPRQGDLLHEAAVGCKVHDAGVAVAVRNEHVSIVGHRHLHTDPELA
jgi:hypothetical protein